VEATAKQLAN
jgi:hypothetical protein